MGWGKKTQKKPVSDDSDCCTADEKPGEADTSKSK